jgi:23S rRNA (guanine745-N1)-methyltransferase
MIDEALGFLRCPQCRDDAYLTRQGNVLRCPAWHSFDIARAGYVSLLPSGAARNPGDTTAMVQARRAFLGAGHFDGLAAAIADVVAALMPAEGEGCVVDVGAGTGFYLAAVLDRLPSRTGLALDISKGALRFAARAHPRACAVGADAWRALPVRDSAADLVLNIFAPRAGAESHRILSPEGHLLVVTPDAAHLAELVSPLGLLAVDADKPARLAGQLSPYFTLVSVREYRSTLALDHGAVAAAVAMGPSSWHLESGTLAVRIGELPDPVTVTVAVRIGVYRPGQTGAL